MLVVVLLMDVINVSKSKGGVKNDSFIQYLSGIIISTTLDKTSARSDMSEVHTKSNKHASVPTARCIYPAEVFVNQDSSFAHQTGGSHADLNCAIPPPLLKLR